MHPLRSIRSAARAGSFALAVLVTIIVASPAAATTWGQVRTLSSYATLTASVRSP